MRKGRDTRKFQMAVTSLRSEIGRPPRVMDIELGSLIEEMYGRELKWSYIDKQLQL